MAKILPQTDKKIEKRFIVSLTHDAKTVNVTEYDMEIIAQQDFAHLIKVESEFRRAYASSHAGINDAPTGYFVRVSLERITTETDGAISQEAREALGVFTYGDSPTDYEKAVFAAQSKGRSGV